MVLLLSKYRHCSMSLNIYWIFQLITVKSLKKPEISFPALLSPAGSKIFFLSFACQLIKFYFLKNSWTFIFIKYINFSKQNTKFCFHCITEYLRQLSKNARLIPLPTPFSTSLRLFMLVLDKNKTENSFSMLIA